VTPHDTPYASPDAPNRRITPSQTLPVALAGHCVRFAMLILGKFLTPACDPNKAKTTTPAADKV